MEGTGTPFWESKFSAKQIIHKTTPVVVRQATIIIETDGGETKLCYNSKPFFYNNVDDNNPK